MKHIKRTPKCVHCGKSYPMTLCNVLDHPVMIGFQTEDGKVLNYCYKCISYVGKKREEGCSGDCNNCPDLNCPMNVLKGGETLC